MNAISDRPSRSLPTGRVAVTSPYSGYSLSAPGEIQVVLPEQGGRRLGPATLLSPASVWARSETRVESWPSDGALRVCLETGSATLGPLSGELHWQRAGGEDSMLGIRLVDVSPAQGRALLTMMEERLRHGGALPEASPLPVQEEISDAGRIATLLGMIAAVNNKAVLREPGRMVRLVLERMDAERGLLFWRCAEPLARWGEPPCEVEVVGYNSAYRMRLAPPAGRGEQWVTPLPERLWRVRHRWHRRVPAPAGLRVRFAHPLWTELGWLEREAVDLSYSGLGLLSGAEDLLFPGLFLPLELESARGERIDLRCEVRHVSFSQTDGRRLCGLEVRPNTERDSLRWMKLVSQSLCPSTRTSEDWLEPLWELYAASGYFNLAGKTSEHFEALRRDFMDMNTRAARLPHLSCQTVWPSERGVEASISSLKMYQSSWMLHQLGRRPGKPVHVPETPGQTLRDVYQRTVEHSQGDPEFRWLFSYAESTVPWVRRTHVRFAERMAESGQSLVMNVRLMDVECSEPSGLPVGELEIAPASMGEKLLLAREIARTRPASYAEALDLTRERLEMRGASRTWWEAGLQRERRILVARRHGLPLAALVLELGQPGANLFRLLDSARLFPLSPEGKEAYVALLDEARGWFALRERTSFVYLCEDDGACASAARLHDDPSTRPVLWIISASLVPEFLEHIQEQSAGRPRSTPHVVP
ncbi:hypothetical protein F0U62_14110 [Cystobacter fuscus]|uniref:hypothetical protein n=1 Tax=Cystobacter fuscus TaxID=43 RepID=UPI002B2AED3A|nr:hypothetical protein F0U62_14110 [Cystobacter fuscus]